MQRALATRKLSVRLSVRLSNASFVTKRKNYLPTFLYHMKDHLPVLWQEECLVENDPFYLKFWVKLTPLERKRQFSINFPPKIALCLKKVCYKVSLCGKCQLRHSLACLSVRKWSVGDVPSTWKVGKYWPTPCKTPVFNLFSLVAPQP